MIGGPVKGSSWRFQPYPLGSNYNTPGRNERPPRIGRRRTVGLGVESAEYDLEVVRDVYVDVGQSGCGGVLK